MLIALLCLQLTWYCSEYSQYQLGDCELSDSYCMCCRNVPIKVNTSGFCVITRRRLVSNDVSGSPVVPVLKMPHFSPAAFLLYTSLSKMVYGTLRQMTIQGGSNMTGTLFV
jgi:hypothetical protein